MTALMTYCRRSTCFAQPTSLPAWLTPCPIPSVPAITQRPVDTTRLVAPHARLRCVSPASAGSYHQADMHCRVALTQSHRHQHVSSARSAGGGAYPFRSAPPVPGIYAIFFRDASRHRIRLQPWVHTQHVPQTALLAPPIRGPRS